MISDEKLVQWRKDAQLYANSREWGLGRAHIAVQADRILALLDEVALLTASPESRDWRPLPENVYMHTMVGAHEHADGRFCMFHARLNCWTFEDDKECLRKDHPQWGK